MNNFVSMTLRCLLIFCALGLSACMSSGPATKYYTLFSDKTIQPFAEPLSSDMSIGVGPIVVPDYLENPSIVSVGKSQRVVVSAYHVWAGDLKEGVSRVLTENLSAYYSSSNIWAFPWDVRARPQYQVRVEFSDFSGARGEATRLKAKWTLIDHKTEALLAIGQASFSEESTGASYEEYVAALNKNLNAFSQSLAQEIKQALMQANASGTLVF